MLQILLSFFLYSFAQLLFLFVILFVFVLIIESLESFQTNWNYFRFDLNGEIKTMKAPTFTANILFDASRTKECYKALPKSFHRKQCRTDVL